MKNKIAALAAAGGALVASVASPVAVLAQAAAAPPAAPAVTPGPAIPGVCVFSQDQAVGASVVGKFVIQRLQQLDAQTGSELNGQKTAIENEAKSLDASRATLAEAAFNQQAQALTAKAEQFQRLAQVRQRESELTQQQALSRIGSEMQPAMLEVFSASKCSILIERGTVLAVNSGMDITAAVVAKLDTKIQQFAFDRARIDPNTGAPLAAGAAVPAMAQASAPVANPPAGPRPATSAVTRKK